MINPGAKLTETIDTSISNGLNVGKIKGINPYAKYTIPANPVNDKPLISNAKATQIEAGNFDYNLNPSTFFSGVDVEVYLDSDSLKNVVLLDNCISIASETSQLQRPVYGYNSFMPDKVLKGVAITRGSFTCIFKSESYLNDLLKGPSDNKEVLRREKGTIGDFNHPTDWSETDEAKRVDFLKNASSEELARVWRGQRNNQLNRTAYKDSVSQGQDITPDILSEDIKFDIIIMYRNSENSDITGTRDSVSTYQIIKGARITGKSKQIAIDGKPVLETYEFVCEKSK